MTTIWNKMIDCFSDKKWRMNHLYWIVDKNGEKVKFRLNKEQKKLFDNLHAQNLILKARQLGFTTFIDLWMLDECLFVPNTEAGIVAHSKEDVVKIFRRKILFPYNNLPEEIKLAQPAITESALALQFNNNSVISVGTSMRSSTLKHLHISEFGRICAHYPEKAREIVTGAMQAIHTDSGACKLFVESTAEGGSGYFFDFCKEAQDRDKLGRKPTNNEFKLHFFPWWVGEDNVQQEPVPIQQYLVDYFQQLEVEIGCKLTDQQKYWYTTKHNRLGDDMMRENPATPDEAFAQSIKGAFFTRQFSKIREEKRITSVPAQEGIIVDTWWDLGMDDIMAIWFTQNVGREIHVIDYCEDSGEGFEYYAKILREKNYVYGKHHAPHDISVRELGTGVSRWAAARKIGIDFTRVPKVKNKIDSINAARRILSICWFDETKCALGISRIEGYRKEWNEHTQTYKPTPLHDENSNGADAFQTLAMGHSFYQAPATRIKTKRISSRGWT